VSISQVKNQHKGELGLFGLLFDIEDGGGMFLRNFGRILPGYTALYCKRHKSKESKAIPVTGREDP
jgi:hypothetical protein